MRAWTLGIGIALLGLLVWKGAAEDAAPKGPRTHVPSEPVASMPAAPAADGAARPAINASTVPCG